MRRLFPVLLMVLAGSSLSSCGSPDRGESGSRPAAERVAISATSVGTGPGRVTILWTFTLADGWHLYSTQRNDSGFPPTIGLTLPEGWAAGPLLWPAPERHVLEGGILDHVYHDRLVLLQELTLPESVRPGAVFTVGARLDWLICRDSCVPGHRELDLEVAVGEAAAAPGVRDRMERALAALPVPAPRTGYRLIWHPSAVEVVVPDAKALEFYPDEDCALLADVIDDAAENADRLVLGLRARDGRIGPLKGILRQELVDGGIRHWKLNQPHGG